MSKNNLLVRKKKEFQFVRANETHLLLCVKVSVVLCHVLRRPLLDQTATQKPDCQASHEHADVRDEHPDAIPCICPNHAGDRQKNAEDKT